ncbi:hypothetical protein SARC_02492 [Sphaeroforma arctica JP610]|uniref:ATP-dependent RNA helicase n=1 Tax=Sphaeroforma arctica JP610 TaxID=667725 RepID=A0A0L0G8R9_9EUKA|nr:hypothetical protein SARC_02492 [Sphaeroforma arctica JP610]KNC85309.1 hypothetical protein SARC_02492 [Sphaeroforma arctica JP610]|eukprot:XP_014159211.1 hypothetical protein SARC_02492 [Sphaeroforma arctica JP610]
MALQVADVLAEFLPVINGTAMVAVGGTETGDDLNHFNEHGAHVVIATPGRMEELMRRSQAMNLKELEILVLDEADRLLDMGFEKSINNILKQLPKQRRTGLFSATQTQQLDQIIRAGLRNPVRVNVKVTTGTNTLRRSTATPVSLKNFFMVCGYEDKLSQLVAFMETHIDEKVIVYMNTCACVDYFHSLLGGIFTRRKTRIQLHSLHGKMVHKKRSKTFEAFKNSVSGALLCTDVAARGLDMPDIDWVVQLDPPQDPDQFVHRCGRTARQGRVGSALVFLAPHEDTYVAFMRKRTVQMHEMKLDLNADDVFNTGRDVALQDRSVYEKGLTAFVSFIRSYREHKCSIIFRVRDLDMLGICRSFALLTLPRMPELKSVSQGRTSGTTADSLTISEAEIDVQKVSDCNTPPGNEEEIEKLNEDHVKKRSGEQSNVLTGSHVENATPTYLYPPCPVDPSTIAYKDKNREAQRQQKLVMASARGEHEHTKRRKKSEQPTAWSQQKERKLIKEKRRDIKAKKREWQHQQTLADAADGEYWIST